MKYLIALVGVLFAVVHAIFPHDHTACLTIPALIAGSGMGTWAAIRHWWRYRGRPVNPAPCHTGCTHEHKTQ